MLSRIILFLGFMLLALWVLQSCGTPRPPVVPTSSLVSSTIGCNNMPCSGSVDAPLILVDGSDPGTLGLPIACSMTSGSQAMNFIAAPSTAWFGVAPGSGQLSVATSTTISVNSMNAAGVSARNVGVVTVSASGYKDNSQMAVELNCNVDAGACKIAFSCELSKYPLP
jgi:hypothetical protein